MDRSRLCFAKLATRARPARPPRLAFVWNHAIELSEERSICRTVVSTFATGTLAEYPARISREVQCVESNQHRAPHQARGTPSPSAAAREPPEARSWRLAAR